MCCNSTRQSSCGCGCTSVSTCGCGCQPSCGCGNNGVATLPIYPDWPVWPCTSIDPDFSVDTVSGFPVYVSLPVSRSATVNQSRSGCPFARG